MSVDLPPPLTLSRIHRLLRPLRSSISSFLSTQQDQERVASQLAPPTRPSAKRQSLDGDYGVGAPQRVKRRSAMGTGSSPFQTKATSKRYRQNPTYGSRGKASATSSETYSECSRDRGRSRDSLGQPRSATLLQDPRSHLKQAGLHSNVVSKALLMNKAYLNVLETVFGASSKQREEGSAPLSLAETMANELGWMIEDSIEQDDDDEHGRDNEDESKARQRTQSIDIDDETTALIEEWYEAVPPYCRGWMMIHHATSIILRALQDQPFAVLELFLADCISRKLPSVAARFYPYLLEKGLVHPTTSHSSLIALAGFIAPLRTTAPLFRSLTSTLLSSSFSDRFFYSDFISLSRSTFQHSDSPNIARLLVVLADVGLEMIASLAAAIDNEDEEEETVLLSEDVVFRLANELDAGLAVLLAGHVTDVKRVAEAVFNVVQGFPEHCDDLASVSTALEMHLLARTDIGAQSEPDHHLSRLSQLHHLYPARAGDHLSSLLPNLVLSDCMAICTRLSEASLTDLETDLLRVVADYYDKRQDGPKDGVHYDAHRDVVLERIRDLERGDFDVVEELQDLEIPIRSESPPSRTDPKPCMSSPIARSSLGSASRQPLRPCAGAQLPRKQKAPVKKKVETKRRRLALEDSSGWRSDIDDPEASSASEEESDDEADEDVIIIEPDSPPILALPIVKARATSSQKRKVPEVLLIDSSTLSRDEVDSGPDELDCLSAAALRIRKKKKRNKGYSKKVTQGLCS